MLTNDPASRFDPEHLAALLRGCPGRGRWIVGFSGGADSSALLHALAAVQGLGRDILAVHVHHGLQPEADAWAEACAKTAAALGVDFHLARVRVRAEGQGMEAAAREARYAALARCMRHGEVLLTAHHRGDQAETVLLQLLRGAGPAGLAAMPRLVAFGPGWHARPLLEYTRDALRRWLRDQGIAWLEDPSNRSLEPARNFVRHSVLALLERRWPAVEAQLAAAADRQAETQHLLLTLGRLDLLTCTGLDPGTLSVDGLRRLPRDRLHNAVRTWLHDKGLPMPPAARLERLRTDILQARPDAMPVLRWNGGEIRRYRDALYASTPLPPHDAHTVITWEPGEETLILPPDGRWLRLDAVKTDVAAAWRQGQRVTLRFRRGGERCRPPGAAHRRSLKHLLQEAGVPPWLRDRIPLLYVEDRLREVIDYHVCL